MISLVRGVVASSKCACWSQEPLGGSRSQQQQRGKTISLSLYKGKKWGGGGKKKAQCDQVPGAVTKKCQLWGQGLNLLSSTNCLKFLF